MVAQWCSLVGQVCELLPEGSSSFSFCLSKDDQEDALKVNSPIP